MLFLKADSVTQSRRPTLFVHSYVKSLVVISIDSLLCQLLSAVWQRLELLLWPGEKLNGLTLRYQCVSVTNHQQHSKFAAT